MTRRDVLDGATSLSYEIYSYDTMNRLTAVNREGANDDTYGYYLDGELKSATYGMAALNDVTYNLDKAGNRTSIVDGGVTKTYTPNTINQYSAAEGSAVTNNAEHAISSYAGVNFGYINDGQLSSVSTGTGTANNSYDALGRCVKRAFGTYVVYYIYDGEKPILEYNPGGGTLGWSVYGKGIDEVVERGAIGLDGAWHWFFLHQDHEGSVTHLTDLAGTVIEKYKYDAFGKPVVMNAAGTVITTTAYDNHFLFTGREYFYAYGYYHYRARAYHPRLGRFTSEDPKLFVHDVHAEKAADDWSFEKPPGWSSPRAEFIL